MVTTKLTVAEHYDIECSDALRDLEYSEAELCKYKKLSIHGLTSAHYRFRSSRSTTEPECEIYFGTYKGRKWTTGRVSIPVDRGIVLPDGTHPIGKFFIMKNHQFFGFPLREDWGHGGDKDMPHSERLVTMRIVTSDDSLETLLAIILLELSRIGW